MRVAVIDVGSNTARLLVATVTAEGRVLPVVEDRAFLRLGAEIEETGTIGAAKIAEAAETCAAFARAAAESDAERATVIVTAPGRQGAAGVRLASTLAEATSLPVRVLSGEGEARLAYDGAVHGTTAPLPEVVGMVDVGGGSTEIAVGTVDDGCTWDATFRVGSGMLTEAYVTADPPTETELEKVHKHVSGVFEGLELPPIDKAVAVGGTATSLRRLVGAELSHETLERGIRILAEAPAAEVAERFDLAPERVELLPAGMVVLEELSDLLGLPLSIGNGGLREGVILSGVAEAQAA